MAIVISIVNLKGGCGKTTLATNLAEGLSRKNKRVVLGDLDEGQNSAYFWSTLNENLPFDCKPVAPEHLDPFVLRHENDNDIIIIDCSPHNDRATGHAIRVADICLCPTASSPLEIWRLKATVDFIKDRQARTGDLPVARVVLSQVKRGTKLVKKSVAKLQEMEATLLDSGTTDLQAFQQCTEHGETVFTDSPDVTNAQAAQKLIEDIVDDVLKLVAEVEELKEEVV